MSSETTGQRERLVAALLEAAVNQGCRYATSSEDHCQAKHVSNPTLWCAGCLHEGAGRALAAADLLEDGGLEGMEIEGRTVFVGPFNVHHRRPHAVVLYEGEPWLVWRHPDGQWVTESRVVLRATTGAWEQDGPSAAENALDDIVWLLDAPEWEYPGQVVRDVARKLQELGVETKNLAGRPYGSPVQPTGDEE